MTHGALWVSSSDGRIEGFEWGFESEEGLQELLGRKGWADVDEIAGNGDGEKGVRIVRSRERNGFFFPGFIGMFSVVWPSVVRWAWLTHAVRYSYSRFAVSEFRDIWIFDAAGLVGDLYVSSGGFL